MLEFDQGSRTRHRKTEAPAARGLAANRDWQLHDAKAHLSELVRRARDECPQRITVYGEDAVVVISAAEFAQTLSASRPGRSLHALLSESPLRDLAFGEEGVRSPVRDVGL